MSKEVIDEQHIYYEVVGDGPHTVLLIPGYIGTIGTDFAPLFPALNKTKFRWICIDPPGYGRSTPPEIFPEPNIYRHCGSLAGKLMKKLGFDKYSIVGWSQGGIFGLKLAECFPANVNKLILWGSSTCVTKRATLFHQRLARLDAWPKEKLDEKLLYFRKEYLEKNLMDKATLAKRWFEEKNGKYLGNLPALECPVLILHGNKDIITDEQQPLNWKSIFKNSRIHYFPEGGHDLHLTHSDEFIKVVEEFLLE